MVLTRPLPPPRILSTTQITNDRRPKTAPFLTDGSRIYFTMGDLLVSQLYQVSTKGGESFPVPVQLANPRLLEISPDRSELLVRSYADQGVPLSFVPMPLWIAPVMGGSPRRVGDHAGGTPPGLRMVSGLFTQRERSSILP